MSPSELQELIGIFLASMGLGFALGYLIAAFNIGAKISSYK